MLGEKRYLLRKGDGITYGPQQTTEYRNDHGRLCEFIMVSDGTLAGRS